MEEKVIDENVIGDELTPKQEAFCQFYTQISSLFGNGTLAYAEAYGYDLDNAPHDDAVWELEDGSQVREIDLETKTDEELKGKKKVVDSTYDRWHHLCGVSASRLLRNVRVDKRVRELLNEMMQDNVVDARLVEIIMKGEDKDSINAIKEFNKLKQRIVEKKDITSGGEKINGFNFIRADEVKQELPKVEGGNAVLVVLPEPTIIRHPTIDLRNESDNTDNQTNS